MSNVHTCTREQLVYDVTTVEVDNSGRLHYEVKARVSFDEL